MLLLQHYLGLVPDVSASAVDAAGKPHRFNFVGGHALADVANGIKNVFKTKLKLNSPLSESDKRGFQLQFCWTHICPDSLRAGARGQEGGQVGPPRPEGRGGPYHEVAGSSAKECKSVDRH